MTPDQLVEFLVLNRGTFVTRYDPAVQKHAFTISVKGLIVPEVYLEDLRANLAEHVGTMCLGLKKGIEVTCDSSAATRSTT